MDFTDIVFISVLVACAISYLDISLGFHIYSSIYIQLYVRIICIPYLLVACFYQYTGNIIQDSIEYRLFSTNAVVEMQVRNDCGFYFPCPMHKRSTKISTSPVSNFPVGKDAAAAVIHIIMSD